MNLNNSRTSTSSIILIRDDDLAERKSGNADCLMSVSGALQEPNTRGQLSLTESSPLDAQLFTPGLCGLVIMSNCPFKNVKCTFFVGRIWASGSYMGDLFANAKL